MINAFKRRLSTPAGHSQAVATALVIGVMLVTSGAARAQSQGAPGSNNGRAGILGEPTALPPDGETFRPNTGSLKPVVPGQMEGETQPQPLETSPPTPLPVIDGKAGELQAPLLEETDHPLPINLAATLKLADAWPLVVSAAQAGVWVAEAQLTRARLLWIPTLSFSSAYLRHDGFGPDLNRGQDTLERPLNQNLNAFYGGFGLINTAVETTDMIFQPLAARQNLNSRKWDIQTAKNDALLQTTNAYFRVHQYRGMYAGALDVVDKGRKLVQRIEQQSKDLVPKAEVDRSKRLLADLEQNAASMREGWRVTSANLTQILRLDPRVVIVPLEQDHLQITLIDPARPLNELMPLGLLNRPELASQKALVEMVAQRIRQEKWRPLLPSLFLNGFQTPGEKIEVGAFGVGSGNSLNRWSARDDFTPQVSWLAESMGLGNLARIKEQRGYQSLEIVRLFQVQDAVAADVTRAQAHLQSAAVRVGQAERALREALTTFDKNYQGLLQTKRFGNILVQVYRPQEVVVSLEGLRGAYDQYFSTVADYNRAQFEMFHALGYPAAEVANLRPAGTEVPVDTTRPAPLPPVNIGPPPATR
jgi:outer membrane protein TolC